MNQQAQNKRKHHASGCADRPDLVLRPLKQASSPLALALYYLRAKAALDNIQCRAQIRRRCWTQTTSNGGKGFEAYPLLSWLHAASHQMHC